MVASNLDVMVSIVDEEALIEEERRVLADAITSVGGLEVVLPQLRKAGYRVVSKAGETTLLTKRKPGDEGIYVMPLNRRMGLVYAADEQELTAILRNYQTPDVDPEAHYGISLPLAFGVGFGAAAWIMVILMLEGHIPNSVGLPFAISTAGGTVTGLVRYLHEEHQLSLERQHNEWHSTITDLGCISSEPRDRRDGLRTAAELGAYHPDTVE